MDYILDVTDKYVLIKLNEKRSILGSAVYNGAFNKVKNILILKVDDDKGLKKCEPPEVTLKECSKKMNLKGKTAGLMTAADMRSFQSFKCCEEDIFVECLLTCGLSNTRCAGDKAEWRQFYADNYKSGTINIVIITNAFLTETAMTESIITVTEAKSSVLQELNIKSKVSNRIATGTGTDSIVIVNGKNDNKRKINYTGKHVLFGEMLGVSVRNALLSSIKIIKEAEKNS